MPFSFRHLCALMLILSFGVMSALGAEPPSATSTTTNIKWTDALKQPAEWYGGPEALRIADNLLLYQRAVGGWPKNIEMASVLTEQDRARLNKQKATLDATIDNRATYSQLTFLARVYTAQKNQRHLDAFLAGLDYLLKAQYPNGGWPQFYPLRRGYYTHITYNDNAMIGVLRLLRDIVKKKPDYAFVDDARRLKAEEAVAKGVDCIVKTQVVIDGRRTVWAAQHDEVTLAPAPARAFEPASLVSAESAGIVRFLMGIDRPNEQITQAIESAMAWFEQTKLTGIRWTEQADPKNPKQFDRVVIKDEKADPLWARFYELKTNRPIFVGRDGVVKYDVALIEAERRNGYAWYTDEPATLLNKDYPAWQKKMERSTNTHE